MPLDYQHMSIKEQVLGLLHYVHKRNAIDDKKIIRLIMKQIPISIQKEDPSLFSVLYFNEIVHLHSICPTLQKEHILEYPFISRTAKYLIEKKGDLKSIRYS